MATITQTYGSYTALAVTALNSLANSATVGWKSVAIDLRSVNALDIEILVKLTMANTAPANDQAAYLWASPAMHDGSAFIFSDGGTATLPASGDASYTIAEPNNLIPLGTLNYKTQNMVMQKTFLLSNNWGLSMPDGLILIVTNFTGAAVSASGNIVAWKPINRAVA